MTPDLSRRVGAIMGAHLVTPSERELIVAAVEGADGWNDLPAEIQRLLEEIDRRPGRGAPA